MEKEINIEQVIQQLLYDHDCVIVPGFGGFVTVYRPATILPKQNVMLPPSREIGFNKNLINNDGLLTNEIAMKSQMSFENSLRIIENRVAFYQNELEKVKRLEIPNIGVLYIDKEGNYRFMPDESKNFLKKSFGLSKIYLDKNLAQENTEKETKIIPIQREDQHKEDKPFAWKKMAMVLAIPLFLLGGYWLGSRLDDTSTNWASLNPFRKKKIVKTEYFSEQHNSKQPENQAQDVPFFDALISQSDSPVIRYSFEDEKISENGVLVRVFIPKTKEVSPNNPVEISKDTSDDSNDFTTASQFNYYIVAGAFKERTNADKLVNKLKQKGFEASIFDKKKNMYYVCFAGYNNKAEAKAALPKVRKITRSAWIKSK